MQTLLTSDALRTTLSGLTYPIQNVKVCSAYEITEHTGFPLIVYEEIINTPLVMETTSSGIGEGPSQLVYQFTIFARDCNGANNTTYTRDQACYVIADTISTGLFNAYNLTRDETGPIFPQDNSCCALPIRMSCVIDTDNYTHATR